MSDVETLQQLVERRLREMGKARGRHEPLSLREAYQALPEAGDVEWVTYELLRRITRGEHSNIGDRAADTLATMLAVPVGDVQAAARQRPRLGKFELPGKADRLTGPERRAVLGVIDAILAAGERSLEEPSGKYLTSRRGRARSVRVEPPTSATQRGAGARRGPSQP